MFFLEQFRKGNIDSEEWKLSLVDTFLQAVYVYDDKFVITLNYSGSRNTITKKMADKLAGGDFSGDVVSSSLSASSALNEDNLNPPRRFMFLSRKVFGISVPHILCIKNIKR